MGQASAIELCWKDLAGILKLRQIGKRSRELHGPALALAHELAVSENKAARWIGKDAVKELSDPNIVMMIGRKKTSENKRALAAQAALSFSRTI
jgi:hypothetical protein